MNWSTIQDAIKDWLEDTTGLTTVWMNQARPITTKPFITVQLISNVIENQDMLDFTLNGTVLEPKVEGHRLLTYQIMAISRNQNAGYDANNYLELARTALNKPVIFDALRAANLLVNNIGAILIRDQVFDNRYESRAILEVQFRAVQEVDYTDVADNMNYIERAEVSSDLGNADDNLDLVDEIIGVPI